MIKRLLPIVVAVAALVFAGYTLVSLDQVVQGTLYSYGLQFSYNWANPYWTLLRVTWAFLATCAVAIIFSTALIVRPISEKPRSPKIAPTQKTVKSISTARQAKEAAPIMTPSALPAPASQSSEESEPKTTPIIAPAPPYTDTSIPGLFKCAHCGKVFTQPLRMLDFHSDPPRIVNVCPFCSETMPSESPGGESEQTRHRSIFKRNNNHGQRPLTR